VQLTHLHLILLAAKTVQLLQVRVRLSQKLEDLPLSLGLG